MDDDKPYIIHSATKITLSSLAKEMARMHGMSEVEMARHLLQQDQLQDAGMIQKEGES
jgi:hypothetical protein